MYERIVVPLDGSPLAAQALSHAEELARLSGAPLHLLRVVEDAPPTIGIESMTALAIDATPAAALLRDAHEDADRYLAATRDEVVARGLAADYELRVGRVVPELLAALRPGDVVVMASHGRGGVARVILGSVAESVIRRASVPVLLVRALGPGEQQEPELVETATYDR